MTASRMWDALHLLDKDRDALDAEYVGDFPRLAVVDVDKPVRPRLPCIICSTTVALETARIILGCFLANLIAVVARRALTCADVSVGSGTNQGSLYMEHVPTSLSGWQGSLRLSKSCAGDWSRTVPGDTGGSSRTSCTSLDFGDNGGPSCRRPYLFARFSSVAMPFWRVH